MAAQADYDNTERDTVKLKCYNSGKYILKGFKAKYKELNL